MSEKLIDVALQILDGLDARTIPRYADEMDSLNVPTLAEPTPKKLPAEKLDANLD